MYLPACWPYVRMLGFFAVGIPILGIGVRMLLTHARARRTQQTLPENYLGGAVVATLIGGVFSVLFVLGTVRYVFGRFRPADIAFITIQRLPGPEQAPIGPPMVLRDPQVITECLIHLGEGQPYVPHHETFFDGYQLTLHRHSPLWDGQDTYIYKVLLHTTRTAAAFPVVEGFGGTMTCPELATWITTVMTPIRDQRTAPS